MNKDNHSYDMKLGLAGNPNVGKSTVFNALTGMNQHTGNWPGKTVSNAVGYFEYQDKNYALYDLPGTYSLVAHSAEEEVTRDFVLKEDYDAIVIVCDAVCLERNLNLVLQVLEVESNVIVCVNLLDEARKKKIHIDLEKLSERLGVPVVGMSARSGEGIPELLEVVDKVKKNKETKYRNFDEYIDEEKLSRITKRAEEICKDVVQFHNADYAKRDRKIDQILTSKKTGIPIMILLLMVIFWITIVGSNYPSSLLFQGLFWIGDKLEKLLVSIHTPTFLVSLLISGIYRVLAWVVSVMLPPMAIFFPMFTILEDLGYLPRVAFNLDKAFRKCCACGKQALTMCMGFGCNACGVTGARIIDSPRERLIAILTNNFVPCNGRFPTLISIISMFLVGGMVGGFSSVLGVLILTLVILLGIYMTFFVSKILSKTLLKGKPSSFILELPPYRKPQIGKVIVRSIFDRTLFVLGRAVISAVPAGIIIWTLANVNVSGMSLLSYATNFLNPFASLIGLDGVILMAFILGFPANEIVVPIILMAYLSTGKLIEISDLAELKMVLVDNGWTITTAICTMLFSLFHWPCATTMLTIKKETGSWKWTLLAFCIPTVIGMALCFLVAQISNLIVYI